MPVIALRNALEQTQATLNSTLSELSDLKFAIDQSSIVAVTDRNGTITHANEKFCEISKYSRQELVGKNHRILNSGFHSSAFFANLWKTIFNGKIWEGEICNRAKDGSLYWVHTFIVPFRDSTGKPYQYVSLRIDITARKAMLLESAKLMASQQVAAQASQLKSEFMANMSHEMRTPLNAVVGMADLLSETSLTAEQRELTTVIKNSAMALANLINDVLDFSKTSAGQVELRPAPFDLRVFFEELQYENRWRAVQKGISIGFTTNLTEPVLVSGDIGRIRQIVTNLVTNAVKFTNEGSVTVDMKVERVKGENVNVKVGVKDTGIGIDDWASPQIFRPFFQADTSSTRRHGGTGLGLSISKAFVEQMGGDIGFESRPGKGSNFWFRLNLPSAGQEIKKLVEVAAASHEWVMTDSKTVLVVEDVETNQKVISLMLQSLGVKFEMARNGLEALDFLKARNFDLVLMDCFMPVMDGFTASRAIRQDFSNLKTPIVAMTASAMPGDREKCLASGMNDYLTKPINKETLARCLQRWLQPGQEQFSADLLPTAGSQMPSIQWEIVERLKALPNGPSLFNELVQLFLKNVPDKIAAIERELESQGAEEVARESHSLKSSICYLGAARMGQMCEQIQTLAHQKSFSQIPAQLDALKSEYMAVLAELQKTVQS